MVGNVQFLSKFAILICGDESQCCICAYKFILTALKQRVIIASVCLCFGTSAKPWQRKFARVIATDYVIKGASFPRLLRLTCAPMSEAWDRVRQREGPGRSPRVPLPYLFTSLFHNSSTYDVTSDHPPVSQRGLIISLALAQKTNISSYDLNFLEATAYPAYPILNNPKGTAKNI